MKPGKELDALIAEKVSGITETLAKPEGPSYLYRIGNYLYENPPAYSTNIALAWEVLDHLNKKGFKDQSIYRNDGVWVVFIDNHTNDVLVEAETAPHAICLAALSAVGYKINSK